MQGVTGTAANWSGSRSEGGYLPSLRRRVASRSISHRKSMGGRSSARWEHEGRPRLDEEVLDAPEVLRQPEVVLQLDEGCLHYAHSGTSEVVRNSAVGRKEVNDVNDVLEGKVCEGRTWSRRSSYEAGSQGMCSRCTRSTRWSGYMAGQSLQNMRTLVGTKKVVNESSPVC